ncbi:MAG TPA: DNA ligase D [Gaiellaceae bacterium]|jgi:bifunctional non-homologous end joining protein LigD
MSPLEEYRRKRDPKQTPEPFGGRRGGKRPIFVIQRHDARRLHYDFRLERDGVLASWAVPKGVPLEPGERALAVHVEDHPLEYASFHGEIPKGNYGAGSVEIWDHGTYELVEEKSNGQLKVKLSGERLNGTWTLVPAHLDGKEQNWLIIRSHDGDVVAQQRYKPMLATVAEGIPRGDGWTFEVKFDGYRAIAYIRAGECELVSRNDNSLTERFPSVAAAIAKAVKTPNAVIDGEITRIGEDGRASFSELQQGTGALVYFAFDVLEVDGESLVDLPLEERKERLRKLLDKRVKAVSFSESFDDGAALFRVAQERHLEGVIAKKKGSPYRQRRTSDWLKIKTELNDEFLIAGYTRGEGRRAGTFGALVLAVHEGDELRYVGNVGTGFSDAEIRKLLKLLKPLHRATSPFHEVPKMPRVQKTAVQWVEPKLIAQVRYSEWTHDRHLRHPAYLGLRDDKEPEEVVSPQLRDPRLRLTNLDKVFWAEENITKGDLLDYYEQVAPVLVPHLKNRPFTMRRYPDGAYGKAFFQKKAPAHMPDWIPRWNDWALVNEPAALLWMVNMGCIDMNAWYSRVDKPERPDFVLFDLDPTPEVPWEQTVEVALILKQLFDALGLEAFPKTSGGKGFHILVPIERRATYENTRHFAEVVAGAVARAHPKLATTEWSKARRRGVLIDANQNGEGKTIASAYSVRPKPGAPVSTPLRWDEVNERLNPAVYTMDVVLERVRQHGDLFAKVLTTRQSLSKALARLG